MIIKQDTNFSEIRAAPCHCFSTYSLYLCSSINSKEYDKKKPIKKALSGLLILTLAGCHPGKEKTQEKCQTLQIETETAAGSIRLSEVANSSLVVLPTSDSLLLSEINQIHLKKDFLYVADPSAVYKFSLSGECLGAIHRQGTGPEEYANVSDFQTDGEHVWVLSRNTQCINSYSWDNSCTSRINLDLWMENICLTDSNTLYIYTGNDMSKDNLFQLHALSLSDSSSTHHFLPVDKAKAQYLFVKSKNIFQQNGSHTYFTQLFNDTVYNLNAAACTPAFVLDFSGKNIPSSFYNQPYEHIMEFFVRNCIRKTALHTEQTVFWKQTKTTGPVISTRSNTGCPSFPNQLTESKSVSVHFWLTSCMIIRSI